MENVNTPTFLLTSDLRLIPFSWRAIFYYLYTNKISFGRLSSQPSVTAEDGASEKVGNGRARGFQMPSSSPKSVYTLARTVGNPSNYLS